MENHAATTHRTALDMLRRYDNVSVRANERWIIEGKIATSAGVSAGIDLALALLSSRWGSVIAESVAENMYRFMSQRLPLRADKQPSASGVLQDSLARAADTCIG